ncbi:hypothetical protein [Nocardia sp. NPDC049149]|uniref:hypothetical protein n=1 Tax=Nocardia sp. NPDC049149 TaxID=3364315 RepID=UPI003724819A
MATNHRAGAVWKLVDDGVLTETQFEAVMVALASQEQRPRGKVVAEIAAYIGAGLVFSGIALVVGSSWEDLALGGRVAVLAAVSIGLVLAGIAVVGGPTRLFVRGTHGPRVRLGSALLALAAGAVAGTVGTALDNGSDDAGSWAVLAGLVAAVLGYAAVPSVIGMLACGLFSGSAIPWALGDLMNADDVWVGIGMLVVGGIWFALTRIDVFVESWLGYAIGVSIALVGALMVQADDRPWAFLLSVLVAAVCFALFAQRRSMVLVLGGGLAVAIAVGSAVTEWTDDPFVAACVVLVIGAIVLGAGAYVLTRSSKDSA